MDHYLIISTEFPPGPGGIGKHAYSLAKSLVANNSKVSIISDMDYATEDEIATFLHEHQSEFDIHRIHRSGASTYINRIATAIKTVRKNKFKKIIVSGKFSIWTGGILKLIFGRKIIVEGFIHGSEARLSSTIQKSLFNSSLRKLNKIWCVSSFTKSLLPADKKIQDKTGIIPNGLNINDWPQDPQNNDPLNWTGYPKLLTVGNISPRKGQHCVVKALPEIIKKYPDAHYHMVGMAKNADRIKQLAQELKVEQRITIHGKLSNEQLIKAYESADIFCMLSENQSNGDVEGFGIAILEANIMGVPAIGSKGCGIEDAIKDGFNGYLADPHNSDAIVNSISDILTGDKVQFNKNCIEWAKKHDWNLLAKNIL